MSSLLIPVSWVLMPSALSATHLVAVPVSPGLAGLEAVMAAEVGAGLPVAAYRTKGHRSQRPGVKVPWGQKGCVAQGGQSSQFTERGLVGGAVEGCEGSVYTCWAWTGEWRAGCTGAGPSLIFLSSLGHSRFQL